MGFNLYFAGCQHKDIENYIIDRKCCRLSSFAEKKDMNMLCRETTETPYDKLFIDSGAIAALNKGQHIDIDEYIEFINRINNVTVWAELDLIPTHDRSSETTKKSSEVSWQQFLYMMERLNDDKKDKLIPVFHYGEPKMALERMLNTEVCGRLTPYIGVGGGYNINSKDHFNYYLRVFKIVKSSKNPNVKIHAFGMTRLSLLEQFPFHSADSTTWLKLGVHGSIVTRAAGVSCISDRKVKEKNNLMYADPIIQQAVEEELSELGYTIQDLATDYKKRLITNVKFFKDWADNYKFKGLSGPQQLTMV